MPNLKHQYILLEVGQSLANQKPLPILRLQLGEQLTKRGALKKALEKFHFWQEHCLYVTYVVSRFKCHTAFFTDIAHWNHVMKFKFYWGPSPIPEIVLNSSRCSPRLRIFTNSLDNSNLRKRGQLLAYSSDSQTLAESVT